MIETSNAIQTKSDGATRKKQTASTELRALSTAAPILAVGLVLVLAAMAIGTIPDRSASKIGYLVLGLVGVLAIYAVSSRAANVTDEDSTVEFVDSGVPNTLVPRSSERYEDHRRLSAHDLIGIDNVLAMAKMNLDIDDGLRVLCEKTGFEAPKSIGAKRLLANLSSKADLPLSTTSKLGEVIDITSRVVHGAGISSKSARNVATAGYFLLDEIASASRRHRESD